MIFPECFIGEAKFRHDSGTELFDQDVMCRQQAVDNFTRPGIFEIEHQRSFTPTQIRSRGG